MDDREREAHQKQMDEEAEQKSYWARNPSEYKKHLDEDRKNREALHRVLYEGEKERLERIRKREEEER